MAELRETLERLLNREDLTEPEAAELLAALTDPSMAPAMAGALLAALRSKGLTADEVRGFASAMRRLARRPTLPPGPPAIDIVGTGGDAAGTLNISTTAAMVVAGCGVPVAKHGNRALSSKSGAADAIAALGISLDVPIERLSGVLKEAGMVFLMAPRHHASMRHAAGPRVELGTRTIFNLLGPLANPARVKRQMTGAFAPEWLRPMAETLARLGSERAWLVHGQGLDELTLAGESHVVSLEADGTFREFTVAPEDAGLPRAPAEALKGGDPAQNAAALEALLRGAPGPYRDVVLLNAAASLIVAGRADDLRAGAAIAARAIDEGAALGVLTRLRAACPPKDAAA